MLPGAPLSPGARAGDATATVAWAPPVSDGDNRILRYTVTASTGQQVTTPDARTNVDFTSLANGTPVTFTVTATTAFGTGPASAPSPAVTPQAPAPAPAPVPVPVPSIVDTQPPTVKITGLKRKLTRKALINGLKLTLKPSERASLAVTLLATKRSAKPLAAKAYGLGLTRKLTLKPKRSRVGTAKRFSVRLRIVATDAAGNRGTTTKQIRITR
jgi:hypothetical protein